MIVYDVQIESVCGLALGRAIGIRKMAGAQINWPCRWVWCLLAASLPRDNSGAWCTVLRCVSVCHVNAFASIDVVQASLKLAIGWHWIKHELWHFASLASWLIYGPRLSVCGVCVIFQATATEAKCANALRGFCRSRNRTLKRANRCTARRRCAIVRTNYDFCFAYLVAVSGGVLLRYSEYNEPHDKPKEQRASTHKKMGNLAEEWNRFEALDLLASNISSMFYYDVSFSPFFFTCTRVICLTVMGFNVPAIHQQQPHETNHMGFVYEMRNEI